MTDECRCKQALTAAFEEAALALGGVVAIYPIPDEAVWDLAQALDAIHGRACVKCGAQVHAPPEGTDDNQHPAIVRLLAQLQGAARCEHGVTEQDQTIGSAAHGHR
ncbi:MAG: hypothetical protein IPK97_13330 [Ahniella sp.]|nr:hypothetical protein [Ahniella sp.]